MNKANNTGEWVSVEEMADKVAKAILPSNFDVSQKSEVKKELIQFAKAIIEATREDYRKNYWPS